MRRRWVHAAAITFVVATGGGCGPGDRASSTTGDPIPAVDRLTPLVRLANEDPSALLAQVRATYDGTILRADIAPAAGVPYSFVGGPDAWRVESAAGTLLELDGEVCFDHAFGERLGELLAASAGSVALDPQPWACAPADFGLNTTATHGYRRTDPRWRLDNLVADDAFEAAVDDNGGVPLVHVRTRGITADGPLDPTRPAYDLWIDAEHRPVRMETADASWTFTYPDDPDDPDDPGTALEPPAEGQRGSYGYNLGPGQGVAKACFYGGGCDRSDPMWRLTWGDGRTD